MVAEIFDGDDKSLGPELEPIEDVEENDYPWCGEFTDEEIGI